MEIKTELRQRNISELSSKRVETINKLTNSANDIFDDIYESLMDFDNKNTAIACKKLKEIIEKIINFSNNSNKTDL
jgi:uncharacterized protein Yka (UPF0111/DUF47 family)